MLMYVGGHSGVPRVGVMPPRGSPPIRQDETWMRRALEQAALGLGRTSPNPPVGCVLVRDGVEVGRGYHSRAGELHAEAVVLHEARDAARGATAYVTLEPCSHHGRTPPCAAALVQAGVKRVVVAALDPDPRVAGRGVAYLEAAGVDVSFGLLEEDALRQQAGFRSLVTRGRPWVVYKTAMTLDGKVATTSGNSRWVSGEAARGLVHRWRNEHDAVAVGSGTVLADDPHLTTRGVPGGRDARPVVFDRRGRTPLSAQLVRTGSILVTHPDVDEAPYVARGMAVIKAGELTDALHALGKLNISSVLLEGGAALAGAFLQGGLVDEVRWFVAPKLLGAGLPPLSAPTPERMTEAKNLQNVCTRQIGEDLLVCGDLTAIPRLEPEEATCSQA